MRTYILWLGLWLAVFPASAQQRMNLKDCIGYGLQNNRSISVVSNEEKMALQKAKESMAAYLPSVSLTAGLDDNILVQKSVIPAGVFGPNDLRVAFTQQYNTTGTAQLDQVIFDKALLTGLKANKFNIQQAELNYRRSEEVVIYNISTAFYQVLVYREQFSILKQNEERYRIQMDVSGQQVKKGVVLETDLEKITVDYNNTRSRITLAEKNLSLSENRLKYQMGYPIKDTLIITGIEQQPVGKVLQSASEGDGFVVTALTIYRLSSVNIALLDIDQKRIRAGMYPKLNLYARYGAVGFGNSFDGAFSKFNPFSTIGIRLNIPIFDFFKRNAQYEQAHYRHLNAGEILRQDEDRYQLEFENARTELLNAKISIENDMRNLELAESVFNKTDLQYQKGVTDIRDWLNTRNALKDAQDNYLNALYDFYQARIEIEKAGGTLKNFYSSL